MTLTARLAAMVLLAGLLGACSAKKSAPSSLPPVSVSAPVARQVVDWDEFVGRFEAIQTVEVRPRISGATISGLGTLISGAYVGMEIGKSKEKKRR